MDATDPNPTTFYLLENKSGSGWDGYLDDQGGVGEVGTNSAKAIASVGKISFIGCTSAEVFNPQGVRIYRGNDSQIEITPGLYIVKLSTLDGNKTVKVIVR
ncbi:MAG: T9SS type A sorting domain-containing protein [Candidatus Limisoma sp.]